MHSKTVSLAMAAVLVGLFAACSSDQAAGVVPSPAADAGSATGSEPGTALQADETGGEPVDGAVGGREAGGSSDSATAVPGVGDIEPGDQPATAVVIDTFGDSTAEVDGGVGIVSEETVPLTARDATSMNPGLTAELREWEPGAEWRCWLAAVGEAVGRERTEALADMFGLPVEPAPVEDDSPGHPPTPDEHALAVGVALDCLGTDALTFGGECASASAAGMSTSQTAEVLATLLFGDPPGDAFLTMLRDCEEAVTLALAEEMISAGVAAERVGCAAEVMVSFVYQITEAERDAAAATSEKADAIAAEMFLSLFLVTDGLTTRCGLDDDDFDALDRLGGLAPASVPAPSSVPVHVPEPYQRFD